MKKYKKFTIITPTLLRDSLIQTCESVDDSNYPNYQHIIIVDVVGIEEMNKDLGNDEYTKYLNQVFRIFKKITNKNRKIIFFHKTVKANDFGNSCRAVAYDEIDKDTDYIMYLDDDDFYINNAFNVINDNLSDNNPDMYYFPCLRFGEVFFNEPPGLCMTTSNQWGHKPIINNIEMRWEKDSLEYTEDGFFLEFVKKNSSDILKINSECLVQVPKSNNGE